LHRGDSVSIVSTIDAGVGGGSGGGGLGEEARPRARTGAAVMAAPSLQALCGAELLRLLLAQTLDADGEDTALPFEAFAQLPPAAQEPMLALLAATLRGGVGSGVGSGVRGFATAPWAAFYGSPWLRSLDLRSLGASGAGELLRDLCYGAAPALAELHLEGLHVLSDRQMQLLAESCPQLEELTLVECRGFTGAGLAISFCGSGSGGSGGGGVAVLRLRQCPVAPLGADLGAALRAAPSLRVLDLANTPTSAAFWEAFGEEPVPALDELHLGNLGAFLPTPREPGAVGGAAARAAIRAGLGRARSLSLAHVEEELDGVFHDLSLAPCANLAALVELDVSYTRFSDQCMQDLLQAAMTALAVAASESAAAAGGADGGAPAALGLRVLKLRGTCLTQAGLRSLTAHHEVLGNVEVLDIGETTISELEPTDALGLRLELGRLPGLKKLVLDKARISPDWTQVDPAADLGFTAHLQSVSLSGFSALHGRISESGEPDQMYQFGLGPPPLANLLGACDLRELVFEGSRVAATELADALACLPNLTKLNLNDGGARVTDAVLPAIQGLPQLKSLSLVNTAVSLQAVRGYVLHHDGGRKLEELACGPKDRGFQDTYEKFYRCISLVEAMKLMELVEARHWKQGHAGLPTDALDELWQIRQELASAKAAPKRKKRASFGLASRSRELYRQQAMIRRAGLRSKSFGERAARGPEDGFSWRSSPTAVPASSSGAGAPPAVVPGAFATSNRKIRWSQDELLSRRGGTRTSLPSETQACLGQIREMNARAEEVESSPWRASGASVRRESGESSSPWRASGESSSPWRSKRTSSAYSSSPFSRGSGGGWDGASDNSVASGARDSSSGSSSGNRWSKRDIRSTWK